MVDVDQVAGRATSDSPPLVARLAGRDLRFRPDPPVVAAADAFRVVQDHQGDTLRQVVAIIDFLDAACVDRDTLTDALRDPVCTGTHVGALFAWLCGEYRLVNLADQARKRRTPRKADALQWGEVA